MATLDSSQCPAAGERPRQGRRRLGVPRYPPAVATVIEDLGHLSVGEVIEQFDVSASK